MVYQIIILEKRKMVCLLSERTPMRSAAFVLVVISGVLSDIVLPPEAKCAGDQVDFLTAAPGPLPAVRGGGRTSDVSLRPCSRAPVLTLAVFREREPEIFAHVAFPPPLPFTVPPASHPSLRCSEMANAVAEPRR